jgi:hypothetical protein
LYNVFRWYNLFWIVFCMLMVEMTLNKNNMLQALAKNGHIQYPAQLLPLLVGGLSFIRVLWLIYAEGRDRVKEASSDNKGRFERHETMTKPSWRNAYGLGHDILKILSPSRKPHDAPVFEEQPPLPYLLRPWHHRYLVALFPWLGSFESWKLTERTGEVDVEQSTPSETGKNFQAEVKVEPSS